MAALTRAGCGVAAAAAVLELSTVEAGGGVYTVGVTSASETKLRIRHDRRGTITSTCDAPEIGGCAADGVWTEFAP